MSMRVLKTNSGSPLRVSSTTKYCGLALKGVLRPSSNVETWKALMGPLLSSFLPAVFVRSSFSHLAPFLIRSPEYCAFGPPVLASRKVAVFCFPCSRCVQISGRSCLGCASRHVQSSCSSQRRRTRFLLRSQQLRFDRVAQAYKFRQGMRYFPVRSVADHSIRQN